MIAALATILSFLLPVNGGRSDAVAAQHRQLRTARRGQEQHFLGFHAEDEPHAPEHSVLAPRPTQYYGMVYVGSPLQEFRVVFDTSSAEMILPSSKCGDASCEKHRRLFPENSSTSRQIGWADDPTTDIGTSDDRDTKTLSLLGADVTGEFVRDNVCVDREGHFCGTADLVVLTEESDEPFQHVLFDGVVGLAPNSTDSPEFNIPHALLGGREVDRGVFALYLASSAQAGGELLFGGYRPERMASELAWASVSSEGNWQVLVEDVTIGGKPAGLCGKGGCQAAVDTGSSLIMSPGNMLWAIVNRLGIDDECVNASATLGFLIGGQRLELERGDYLEQGEDGCRLLMGSLSDLGKGHPTFVLGYPFLRKYYTVFDYSRHRVGFALADHGAETSTAPAPAGTAAVRLLGIRP